MLWEGGGTIGNCDPCVTPVWFKLVSEVAKCFKCQSECVDKYYGRCKLTIL